MSSPRGRRRLRVEAATSTPRSSVGLALARRLGRPVRWIEERTERRTSPPSTAAADPAGHRARRRRRRQAPGGAGQADRRHGRLPAARDPGIPILGAFLYHGPYDVGAYSFTCSRVFTNRTPTDAYRGAGRPEATYAIERAMDALARRLGVDPAEIRRRNFDPAATTSRCASPAGCVFDSGNYEPALERALELHRQRRGPGRAGRAGARTATDPPARHRDLLLRRDVRPGAAPGAGLAQVRRRRLGGGTMRVLPQARCGGHGHVPARPGARDVLVDDRGRPARHRPRRHRGAALATPPSRRTGWTPTASQLARGRRHGVACHREG